MSGQKRIIRRNLLIVGVVYLLGALVVGPLPPETASKRWHLRLGPVYVGRPACFTGDSPHYLLIVNSLIEDLDLDLSNNHRQVREGDWDAGTRYRGQEFGEHVDTDSYGRALSIHPPFMPLLLATVAWPFRGTAWVEPLCLLCGLLVTLLGVYVFMRWRPDDANWGLVLGLASPLFCYARDLWTEPWQATAWVLLLASQSLPLLAVVAFYGVLIKYTFAVVPFCMGAVDLWRREWRRGLTLMGAAVAAVLFAFLWAQYAFRFTDHFHPLHMAYHRGIGSYTGVEGALRIESGQGAPSFYDTAVESFSVFRGKGLWGLLVSPVQGLLPFFPVFAWGILSFRKGGRVYLPAAAFYLLHASYVGWRGGTAFSARYLVPMLPVLVLGVAESRRRPVWLFRGCLLYSLCWGLLAGFLPVAVVERSPLEVVSFLLDEIEKAAFW